MLSDFSSFQIKDGATAQIGKTVRFTQDAGIEQSTAGFAVVLLCQLWNCLMLRNKKLFIRFFLSIQKAFQQI